MKSFFKIFFASLLALVVFSLIAVFIFAAAVAGIASKQTPQIPNKSVLILDLSDHFPERQQTGLAAKLNGTADIPGLYDVIRLIDRAKTDDHISGILIKADDNANGLAASNELRKALLDFRSSKKFILAQADVMSQSAYYVATAADKIYLNPAGMFQWRGFAVSLAFLKGTLDKLEVQPQIFYAGKFKSATEPFRASEMTPENELQTSVWLNDLYHDFLQQISERRGVDTATLHQLATTAAIQTPQDALNYKLIDGLKYDDEVRSEIKQNLSLGKTDKLNYLSLETYNEAINLRKTGKERIAVIYAEGEIIDGEGSDETIGGERFRKMIRKARLDNSVKAIVLRVNSGGGSALASEVIWRELKMAKEDGKPVVVSFGDVAASGGYYIACGADSIFASANTITGSIGVFTVIPDLSGFFKNKLGITFDGVKTAPHADMPSATRPMTDVEKQQMQNSVDRVYLMFKQRVAEGRKKSIEYIDSIAQGRVWSGTAALQNGLIDRIATLDEAIASAAAMAQLKTYGIKEFPEPVNWLDDLLDRKKTEPAALLKQELGTEEYKIYREWTRIKQMTQSVQARMPFEFFLQ